MIYNSISSYHLHKKIVNVFIQPLRHKQDVAQGYFFLAEYNWFEFIAFLPDWLPYQKPILSYYLPITGRDQMVSCLSQQD